MEQNNHLIKDNYYSVYIPNDLKQKSTVISEYIFKDKNEALQISKKNKLARFKQFNNYQEAKQFALYGTIDVKVKDHINNNNDIQSSTIGEKSSLFKGPKPQDLIKLRKCIENNDINTFKHMIWDNPRYLVSSGDTPSILQEGSRYNALHVAAKSKNKLITELILNTMSDENFIKLLYGDDNKENIENRIKILLDLYLNTPDKGVNETPLHFAVKLGAVDVVEILVSYPQCDKTLKNKYNKIPEMMICERCDAKDVNETIKRQLKLLLGNFYFVPILRAEDNSLPPLIGEPFSPGESPKYNNDPLSPRLEIRAYAGPMNKDDAKNFRKTLKTPPRLKISPNNNNNSYYPNHQNDLDNFSPLRYTDLDRGLERFGQKLANKKNVNWKEFWPFLNDFVDITSKEGLDLLEKHLAEQTINVYRHFYMCNAFENLSLNDKSPTIIDDYQVQQCFLEKNNDNFNLPILCIEKACDVFANRIANCFIDNNFINNNCLIIPLKNEIKHLEQLIISCKDDERFNTINFQLIHYRIGKLIPTKLNSNIINNIKEIICDYSKSLDYFSSDDEANCIINNNQNKPTSHKKQLLCLLQNIDNYSNLSLIENDMDIMKVWQECKLCLCIFRTKKSKKTNRNSFKYKKNSLEKVNRKLFTNYNDNNNTYMNNIKLLDSSDDEFYTPPSSPAFINLSEDEEFSDIENNYGVFIEGLLPTKSDCEVFNALNLQKNICDINFNNYPNIYRWLHTILLYSKAEREKWSNSNKIVTNNSLQKTPEKLNSPSKSWLRITGVNSPKSYKK